MAASTVITDYMAHGVIASRPASLTLATGAIGLYYADDTGIAYAWDGSAWQTLGPSFAAGAITNRITSDVTLTVAGTYYLGPTCAQGSTGTWFATGKVTIVDVTSVNNIIIAKLWDGTTVVDVGCNAVEPTSGVIQITVCGYLATPAGNLRISCAAVNHGANAKIACDLSGLTNKDSSLTVFRIA